MENELYFLNYIIYICLPSFSLTPFIHLIAMSEFFKFLWTTYRKTDMIEGPPLTCSQQRDGPRRTDHGHRTLDNRNMYVHVV